MKHNGSFMAYMTPINGLIVLSFLIGLTVSFKLGLSILVIASFAFSIGNLLSDRLLIFLSILICVDPITRVYIIESAFVRYNSFNYILLSIIIIFMLYRKVKVKPISAYMWLLLWMGIGISFSSNAELGLLNLLNYLNFLAFYLVFSDVYSRPNPERVIQNALQSGLIVALSFSILFFVVFGLNFFSLQLYRMEDLQYINPNSFSYLPLVGLIFSFLLKQNFGESRKVHIAVQVVLLFLIAISGSRGSLLIGFAMLFFTVTGRISIKLFVTTSVILILFLQVNSLLLKNSEVFALQRLAQFFDTDIELEDASSGRTEIAKVGYEIFLDHPLIGAGTGSFRDEFVKATREGSRGGGVFLEKRGGMKIAAHSTYVKVLAENGIIGFFLLMTFILSIYTNRSNYKLNLISAVVIALAFLSTEFGAKGPWFIAALSVAGSSHYIWQTKHLKESKLP